MTSPSKLRALLVLGRVSNLPTVWSNCLAGWLLGGGGDWNRFAVLCGGATLLYVGGMYLNDAFDAEFDAEYRRERPIPSGAISRGSVWRLGVTMLVAGTALMFLFGLSTAIFGLLLAASILLYDWLHKMVTFSPLLMALCRLLLYLTAASAAVTGVTGLAMWSGLALAAYIVGLSYLARKEATGVVIQHWPQLLLVLPPVLALVVNDRESFQPALLIGAVFVLWTVRTLRSVWMEPRNVPRAVGGLLAGICWVDLLAVVDQPREMGLVFAGCFVLALVLQKFVPAT
jgi:4-hydroxybenzoate polyprenyltransferase